MARWCEWTCYLQACNDSRPMPAMQANRYAHNRYIPCRLFCELKGLPICMWWLVYIRVTRQPSDVHTFICTYVLYGNSSNDVLYVSSKKLWSGFCWALKTSQYTLRVFVMWLSTNHVLQICHMTETVLQYRIHSDVHQLLYDWGSRRLPRCVTPTVPGVECGTPLQPRPGVPQRLQFTPTVGRGVRGQDSGGAAATSTGKESHTTETADQNSQVHWWR